MSKADSRVKAKEQRQIELIRYLQTPRTVDEVAGEFGISYITAYRQIGELQEKNLVGETPFRRGNKKLYLLRSEKDGTGTVTIPLASGRYITPVELALNFRTTGFLGPVLNIEGAIAQAYRYKKFHGTASSQFAGSVDPKRCKAELYKSIQALERMRDIANLLYLGIDWDGPIEQFGEEQNVNLLIELARFFEFRLGDVGERQSDPALNARSAEEFVPAQETNNVVSNNMVSIDSGDFKQTSANQEKFAEINRRKSAGEPVNEAETNWFVEYLRRSKEM